MKAVAVPADLRVALCAEPAARVGFFRFALPHRKAHVHWVTVARRPETRQRRIAAVVRNARLNRRPGMGSPYRWDRVKPGCGRAGSN